MEKKHTYELEKGDAIRPFGTVTDVHPRDDDKYAVTFDSGKTREFRGKNKWWIEPSRTPRVNENGKESDMVSHRRKPSDEMHISPDPAPEGGEPVAHYAQNFQRHADAAEKAVEDARMVSTANPEGAIMFLHEATVHAALAQGHATMANAMSSQDTGVEIAVREM